MDKLNSSSSVDVYKEIKDKSIRLTERIIDLGYNRYLGRYGIYSVDSNIVDRNLKEEIVRLCKEIEEGVRLI
jgi:hypothetical protein